MMKTDHKISKQAINKLLKQEVDVTLYNGCFNVAKVKSGTGRVYWELRVQVTHKMLEWQCGNKQEITLIRWEGSNGYHYPVTSELNELVLKMQNLATMKDEDASKLSLRNKAAFLHSMKELGIV